MVESLCPDCFNEGDGTPNWGDGFCQFAAGGCADATTCEILEKDIYIDVSNVAPCLPPFLDEAGTVPNPKWKQEYDDAIVAYMISIDWCACHGLLECDEFDEFINCPCSTVARVDINRCCYPAP